jgi:ADP-ribosyl-[dinitrogen reductase] hydrolase
MTILGTIIGDIVGSAHEFSRIKTKDFPFFTDQSIFTDDTIMSLAVAKALMDGLPYDIAFRQFGERYPNPCGGYGAKFSRWLMDKTQGAYNSMGNGAAMRVSPVAYAFDAPQAVLAEAEKTALPTHNHPEGIKGAQATALAIFLARQQPDKAQIKDALVSHFGYDLDRPLVEVQATYQYNEICPTCVPEAIIAFLEASDFEDAIRNAISLGGDADTLAAITGSIAGAYYDIPAAIKTEALGRLDARLRGILTAFEKTYGLATIG